MVAQTLVHVSLKKPVFLRRIEKVNLSFDGSQVECSQRPMTLHDFDDLAVLLSLAQTVGCDRLSQTL